MTETHTPLTAKDAVVTWLNTLNDHPKSLASIYYPGGGAEAHLEDYSGTVARLTLRYTGQSGEEVSGWEIDPAPNWSPPSNPATNYWGQDVPHSLSRAGRSPATTYWGPDPIGVLHNHLTRTYNNTTNKETP